MLSRFFIKLSLPSILALTISGQHTPPPRPMDFDVILSELPKASPLGHTGSFSTNLSHLNAIGTERQPTRSKHYRNDLDTLRSICPSLDKNQNILTFLHTISDEELKNAPRKFLMHAHFTVSGLKNTDQKTHTLTRINKYLLEPEFMVRYMDQKRSELHERIHNDPVFIHAQSAWQNEDYAYKQRVLQHLSNVTMDTLLPDTDKEYPRVIFVRGDYTMLGPNTFGLYISKYNEVYINGMLNPNLWDFNFAAGIAIHETFHAFEFMLVQWNKDNQFQQYPMLQEQARLYELGTNLQRSSIRFSKSPEGYRLSFIERGSWAFQRAAEPLAQTALENTLTADLFISRNPDGTSIKLADAPSHTTNDTLPSACLK